MPSPPYSYSVGVILLQFVNYLPTRRLRKNIPVKTISTSPASSKVKSACGFITQPEEPPEDAPNTTGSLIWPSVVLMSYSPLSFKKDKKKSHYTDYGKSNYYHAGTKGNDKKVMRCEDGSYHRDCTDHKSKRAETIKINTEHKKHSTGLGVGYMYLSADRESYRTKYNSNNKNAAIYIGRPIRCNRKK